MAVLPSLKPRDISPSFRNPASSTVRTKVSKSPVTQTPIFFVTKEQMKVHKDVVEKNIILYEQRKLNKDRTWKAAHGRQFRVESEY